MAQVGIICPTWNNMPYFLPCLRSVLRQESDNFHVYVANNGEPESCSGILDERVTVLNQTENLGWEGGLKAGIEASVEPFIIFLNDDTFIPKISSDWIEKMLLNFKDPSVGAVGPMSNVVMGHQNIFAFSDVGEVNFLIGFCMMVRREALELSGGIDDTLSGGDDLDLSIRLRKKGYRLLVDPSVFVYHHGFKTGERIHGGPSEPEGWNSARMTEKTNWGLITKHGIREWMHCMDQTAV